MKQSVIRLSQCMIVKNEEKQIEQALSWGKGVVWEQIVVDTGSSDQTMELAEQQGAKVSSHPWKDDFSAAKNYAIDQAKGDWIAFFDADETLSQEEAAKILPLLEQVHTNKQIDAVRVQMAHLDDRGTVISTVPVIRLFRNEPNIRYRYRVHEELYHKEKAQLGCYDAKEQLLATHTGYGQESQAGGKKGLRNLRLLQEDLKTVPQDAMRRVYLADAFAMAGREEEAKDGYREVLGREAHLEAEDETPYLRAGLQLMALLSKEPPEETGEEYTKICAELRRRGQDQHPDLDYFQGLWYAKAGERAKAAVLFESAMGKLEQYAGRDSVRLTGNLGYASSLIAEVALKEHENPQKAVQYGVMALRINKYDAAALETLLGAFLTEYRPGAEVESYWKFLGNIYQTANSKEVLFLYKIADRVGFKALRDRAKVALPSEIRDRME